MDYAESNHSKGRELFTDAISNQEELEDEANKGNEADSEPDDSLEDASTN